MKSIFIKAFLYVKSNLFACACFFWAIMIFLIGSFSYARFISSEPIRSLPQAGSFVCSANIDGVSSLSFTNTAFWGGTLTDDKVAMSALRSIDFTVNNFKMVGDKKVVNEVKTSYSLSFSAPVNFTERLALQPFKFDELGVENPLLPQIVISDIMHAGGSNTAYHTKDSDDYQGVDMHDMEFTVTKSGDTKTPDYIATSYDTKGNVVAEIRLEHFTREAPQTLLFRMWNVSHLTSEEQPSMNTESGKLLPPLEITATQTIDYYKIIISIPGVLVMPAAVETTYNHSVQLTPTHTISDEHLAGYFVNYDENGVKSAVKEIYADDDKQWTVERVEEGHVGKFYTNEELTNKLLDSNGNQVEHVHDFNVMDSYTIYNEGETITGKPVTFTEVLEHQHGNWKYADPTTVNSTIDTQTGVGMTKDWNGNWSKSNSGNPDYRASVNVVKTTTTSYSAMTVGTLTREVTETEDIYVLGTKEGYTKPTLEKVYLRVKYSDTISSASVTGPVTKTVATTYTYNITMQKREWSYGSYTYNDYTPNDNERQAILKLLYGELLTGDSVETTEDVSINLGTSSEVRYQLREITRNILKSKMTINDIKWVTFDKDGNTAVDADGKIIYQHFDSQETPLKLYGDDGIQDYYLSPCYSKNYPFYVDVIFEQIQ